MCGMYHGGQIKGTLTVLGASRLDQCRARMPDFSEWFMAGSWDDSAKSAGRTV